MRKEVILGQGYCRKCLGPVDESGFCKRCVKESMEKFKKIMETAKTYKPKKNVFDIDNIENKIDGYKYVVGFSMSPDDPLDTRNQSLLCTCDTRDECIEEIKKDIKLYQESNIRDGYSIFHEDYNINRLGTIIKWYETKDDKSWFWSYNIYPVRYVNNK